MPDLHADGQKSFRLSGRAAFATYRTPVYAGEYQGYSATASYSHPWIHAEAALAGYRIVRNGLTDRGLGDVALATRGTFFRSDQLSLGVELAATLPTGNADLGLGMGHAMLMPGVWAAFQRDELLIFLQLAYGRALGDTSGGGHQHTGTGALVNPMNRSELEHALTISYTFAKHLFAGGRLLGAVPVAAPGGSAREVAGLGVGGSFAFVQLDLELQLPLVAAPFETKTLASISALF